MLQLHDISTYYGQIRALEWINLEVHAGEIVTLIGANGAGKTTLLNTISGILTPKHGQVMFDGKPISNRSAEHIVQLGISHVPERRQVFSKMSVNDNLLLGAYHRRDGNVRADIQQAFELFPILGQRRNQQAGTLSGGEQQMLAIARGLMGRPKLLMLDEPSVGLAPLVVREILRIVVDLRSRGTTILLIEQNAKAALQVADRGYVLETGRVVLKGTAKELLADEGVQKAYLGKGNRLQLARCREATSYACVNDSSIKSCVMCPTNGSR
ncbi:MAG: branched-chain amino acid ABC transporter ATP-binding protein [Chloroflexi bacterium RBG_16_56_8]|nr:MAG: branched-chain amino acid ABC transporter ATP-binding protein [Chloroflexi bacterium RBG_16_56_8]